MANRYIPEGSPITGKITLQSGDLDGKTLTVRLKRKHSVDGRSSREIEVQPAGVLNDSNTAVSYRFDKTEGILAIHERICEVRVWLLVNGTQHKHTQRRIFIYRPGIEIHAQDETAHPIEDAECKLSVGLEADFEASNTHYDQSFTRGTGSEIIWTSSTHADGIVRFSALPVGDATGEWSLPYTLSDRGWLTEGEFTPQGPKRKAVLWKAPLVHYVWWGNPVTSQYIADATDTPKAMANLGVHVKYWCQPAFTANLGTKIEKCVINQPSDLLNGLGTFKDLKQHLNAIVQNLTQYGALSAVKDLLSLCVLLQYGGYYFDTTTKIVASRAELFQKLVAHKTIRIVRTASGGAYFFRALDRSVGAVLASQLESAGNGVVTSKNCDVWAMYAPHRNHDDIAVMIESYLERAYNLGFHNYPNGQSAGLWGNTVHQVMTDADRTQRNELIAKLIMTSVQEALWSRTHGNFDGIEWDTAFANDSESATYNVSAVCADLGIGKRHAGNWRRA